MNKMQANSLSELVTLAVKYDLVTEDEILSKEPA